MASGRGQATPITVMILTSIVIVIGLGLIAYVNSMLSSYRAISSSSNVVAQLSSSTLVYIEHHEVANATDSLVYLGIGDITGRVIRYYVLVLPSTGGPPPAMVDWRVVDPPGVSYGFGIASSHSILLYAGNGIYMPLDSLYPSLKGERRLAWLLFGPGYSEPYLVRLELHWANKVQPFYIIVLARIGNGYYEVARLYVLG